MIATMDQMLNAMANNRQRIPFSLTSTVTIPAAQQLSFWSRNGANKDSGVRPVVATICDNTTAGGLYYTNATSGNTLYTGRISLLSGSVCEAIFTDRLAHNGSILMSTATTQAVNIDLSALALADNNNSNLSNRIGKSDYSEVMWRFESHNGIAGSAAITPTINYTNHLGVAKTTTISIPGASFTAGVVVNIIPQAGDNIRSIESITLGTSATSSLNSYIVAYNDRFSIPLPAINNMIVYDWEMLGLPKITEDTCLSVIVGMASTVPTIASVSGTIMLIQG